MALTFWKYHGSGNDFVLFDGLDASTSPRKRLTPEIIRALCDRHTGVGADGVIVAESAPDNAYRMTYFNADGHQAEMCGNGIRCLVALLRDLGKDMSQSTRIITGGGTLKAMALDDGTVRNTMPTPVFPDITGIPQPGMEGLLHTVEVNNRRFQGVIVNIGNPHLVIPERVSMDELLTWGPRLEHHPAFPNGTNVEFMEAVEHNTIRIQIWERGVGRTLACGSGAAASAVAAAALGEVDTSEDITVVMDGGNLSVNISPGFQDIWLQGPAQFVFQGTLTPEGGWHGLVS
jgi:diaminopimelate epimerase